MAKEKGNYLRFLNSCIPSIVVTYWNLDSISFVASFAVVAPVQVHSSSSKFGKCMYRWVVVSFVCPINTITVYGFPVSFSFLVARASLPAFSTGSVR